MTKPKHIFLNSDRQALSPGVRNFPTSDVCRRYNCSESTLRRWWTDPDLEFPQPFKIVEGGGNFFRENELDAFDRDRAERARTRREERTAWRVAEAERIADEARAEEAQIAARRARRRGAKRTAEVLP
jgi:hypothetical protein